ncbi:MAG: hypothetical protein MUF54_16750 [Polyangiaceae bacterium]|nr:hypothetical protein [Polyangiaceae bacterium]
MKDSAVTHLDLMLYMDGELEPSREQEVRAYLDQSPEARAIVASLLEVGDLVRGAAEQPAVAARADGIADAVMRKLGEVRAAGDFVSISATPGAGRRAALARRSTGALAGMMAGGLAVAAAVAFVVWRVAGVQVAQPGVTTAALRLSPIPPELMVSSATLPAGDHDARTGTIFYVPTESGTTTVVWLSEEQGGGD